MSKTLIWVLVGVLAAAGVAAVALVVLRPDGASTATAAPTMPTPPAAASSAIDGTAAAVPATEAGTIAAPAATQPAAAPAPLSTSPTIDQLIQNAAAYEGRPVVLRGTILTQCMAGCEFSLADDTGVLLVQLEGKGKDRLIPLNKVGKAIEIRGVFRGSPRPRIVIEDPNGWQFVK